MLHGLRRDDIGPDSQRCCWQVVVQKLHARANDRVWRGGDTPKPPHNRGEVRRSQTPEAAPAAFILQEGDAPRLDGCGAAMNLNFRRKGSVVHRHCSSDETRPLLSGHVRGLTGVMGGRRHSRNNAAVILWLVR